MLRSLTSRLTGKARSAGIMIERSKLSFVYAQRTGKGWHIKRAEERSLGTHFFAGSPTQETQETLATLLSELAPELAEQYLPLHVSISGPMVRIATFSLDVLPKTHTERLHLVEFLFKQTAEAEQSLVCDYELVGKEDETQLMLGFAMDKAWHTCIHNAFLDAKLIPWTLNANICRQFNQFYPDLTGTSQGAALLVVDVDAWSLMLWDARGRVRYCGSRWRNKQANEFVGLAEEVERRILTCVASLPALVIETLFLVSEESALVDTLNKRLREPCINLELVSPETRSVHPDLSWASFTAAMQG